MYKKVPPEIRVLAKEKEHIFRENPFDQRLRTHKLHGKFEGAYAFSINYDYRIIFDFVETSTVTFLLIGDHDIYD